MLYLIAYDIADETRRRRLSNLLLGFGNRLQESLFSLHLDPAQLSTLRPRLESHLQPLEDTLHIIPLCARCEQTIIPLGLGQSTADPPYYVL